MRFSSSGDLLADRRYAYGRAYRVSGDHAAAADLFAQAVELAPRWTTGWFALGEALQAAGDPAGAKAAFAKALALDADDVAGVAPRLARLLGRTPAALPRRYVAALFDQYAARFDQHLIEELGYAAPALILAALEGIAPGRRFALALDLGCGTGLMGAAIRDRVGRLEGVDLSEAMVAEARKRGIYDALAVGDAVEVLRAFDRAGAPPPPCGEALGVGVAQDFPSLLPLEPAPIDKGRATPTPGPSPQGGGETGVFPPADEARPDLLLAADVLVYLGDLDPLFAAASAALRPTGLFAFTVERHADAGYVLQASLRYAHGAAYLRELAARHGFSVETLEAAVTRRDSGKNVPGLLAVLQRI